VRDDAALAAHLALGTIHWRTGEYTAAERNFAAARLLYRALGDTAGEGRALTGLGSTYAYEGHNDSALTALTSARLRPPLGPAVVLPPSSPAGGTSPGQGSVTATGTGSVEQSGGGQHAANTGVVGGDSPSMWSPRPTRSGPRRFRSPRRMTPTCFAGPSGLLAAGSRVVKFVGRTSELARLTTWRDGSGDLSVMLLHAPGGQGKTRLAAAFAERSATDGWAVTQARHHSDPRPPVPEFEETSGHRGLLVVVDYAERWPRINLERLFQSHFLRQGRPARVLLVARPADYWWKSLANPLFKLNAMVEDMQLGALADTVAERQVAFTSALDRFAQVLGASGVSGTRPAGTLADDAYALVLTLHMAALVAVTRTCGVSRRRRTPRRCRTTCLTGSTTTDT
jgi:hypothetical protein